MLYLIGIGLNDEKDISLKGLEAIKKCKFVYLEYYTSKLNVDLKKLEKLYGKKIIIADRSLVENSDEIIQNSKKYHTALLVIGDVFGATTHINFLIECKKNNIEFKIIHNASVLTAVGETGLELYKFGKTTSIPFNNKNVKTTIEVIKQNQKNDLHTLILLDLDPINNRFMNAKEAVKYLLDNGFKKEDKIIVCSQLGGSSEIVYSDINTLVNKDFNKYPQSIIIPAKKLHFVEEESLELWKI
jgi:diphthine synthase